MDKFIKRAFEDGLGLRKDLTIGFPMSPGAWVGEATYTPVSRIKVTCGGGMGGVHWYETTERIDVNKISFNKPLVVTTIDGNKKLLNPAYIVEIDSEITMVTRKFNSRNTNYPTGTYTYSWLIRDGEKVTFKNKY